jgi:hypothetical protein
MWFWPVNEMTELVSGMPAAQFGDESSWVRGSELVQGSRGSCVSFWYMQGVFPYPLKCLSIPQVKDHWFRLTSWSWALLEKLPVAQLLTNFPTFYGTRRFITLLTRTLPWYLYWATWIQSISHHPVSLRSILILPFHLRVSLPRVVFVPGFPIEIPYALILSPCVLHAVPIASSSSWSF